VLFSSFCRESLDSVADNAATVPNQCNRSANIISLASRDEIAQCANDGGIRCDLVNVRAIARSAGKSMPRPRIMMNE
jgi:hypothetical protein